VFLKNNIRVIAELNRPIIAQAGTCEPSFKRYKGGKVLKKLTALGLISAATASVLLCLAGELGIVTKKTRLVFVVSRASEANPLDAFASASGLFF
jgi:hypothetical protein